MEAVKNFLKLKTDESLETLCSSPALVWVDWREYDEDIVKYIEESMQTGKLSGESRNAENKMGFDIVIHWKGKEYVVPYPDEEGADRDSTIKYLNRIIQPDYEIRLFMESIGSDTLGFLPLAKEDWAELEKEFGAEKVGYYFMKIDENSIMFNLDIDDVFKIVEERQKNNSKEDILC